MGCMMPLSKLEQKVVHNAGLLDKKMDSLVKDHAGKYVVFFEGKTEYSDDFNLALLKGDEVFGNQAGFVVRKVSKSVPVFACLTSV